MASKKLENEISSFKQLRRLNIKLEVVCFRIAIHPATTTLYGLNLFFLFEEGNHQD